MRRLGNNRGVALVTVLLITVLVTTLLVALMKHQQVAVRRTARLLEVEQAGQMTLGMADWAARVLRSDLKDGAVDHLDEDWAQRLAPMPVEGGMLSGYLEDLQGRFNLNNVMAADSGLRQFSRQQFGRLLEGCGQDRALVDALVDWIDEDGELSGPGGAEDETYLHQEGGYQTGNQPLVSPSELRLVAGMNRAWSCLEPLVTALPAETPVNVNTASARVLASLSETWSEADAARFVEERPGQGFATVAAFLEHEGVAGSGLTPGGLAVASSWFLAVTQADIGESRALGYSLLERQNKQVLVKRRALGVY